MQHVRPKMADRLFSPRSVPVLRNEMLHCSLLPRTARCSNNYCYDLSQFGQHSRKQVILTGFAF